jgi:tRNA (guanosine-2'-O-)-methyltransferase
VNAERFARLRRALERRQPDLTVLMDGVHKPHNFSAILRSCDATGAMRAHVVPPRSGVEVHHGASAGSKKWVRVRRHASTGDAVEHLSGRGFTILAAHPSDTSVDFREIDFTRPTAVMMGAEKDGVSDEGLRLADGHIVIPTVGMVHSLNVSVATALILFEAMRQRELAGMYEKSRLPPGVFERRLFEWAHPRVAAGLRREGRPYPGLTEDGQILRE